MSTKKITQALAAMRSCIKSGEPWTPTMEGAFDGAHAELEAIRKAAKDLTRLHLSDGADDVAHRSHVVEAMTTPESQWTHPDVVAWAKASQLLATIATESES